MVFIFRLLPTNKQPVLDDVRSKMEQHACLTLDQVLARA